MDTSGSMKFNFDLDPSTERQLENFDFAGQVLGAFLGIPNPQRQLYERLLTEPGPDRIDVAKDALKKLVRASKPDVTFRLASFSPCGPPRSHGSYPPPARGQLMSRIDQLPIETSTALAAAIAALPGISEGGADEGNPVDVVLVSDGRDSCRGDPCAAARQVAAARPHMRISVIAMGAGLTTLRCVSQATGGQFVEARNASRLADQFVTAAGQDLPEQCR
jgi:hypothetical protein